MADMFSNPQTAQMMSEALNNPALVDMMIQSNPQLRAMGPQARQLLQSPMFRQMMTNPDLLRQAAQTRRMFASNAGSAFPAPGLTDTTPSDVPSTAPGDSTAGGDAAGSGQAAGANPFSALFGMPGAPNLFGRPGEDASAGQAGDQAGAAAATSNPLAALLGAPGGGAAAAGANPFAALFGTPGAGAGASAPAGMPTADQMAAMFQAFGGGEGLGAGPATTPADTRPPEEIYESQLRQLNDMGFFDFDANVRALRRSGGSVQGAVNSLMGD
jgi:ubiquilin